VELVETPIPKKAMMCAYFRPCSQATTSRSSRRLSSKVFELVHISANLVKFLRRDHRVDRLLGGKLGIEIGDVEDVLGQLRFEWRGDTLAE